jgi:hypothetical protein
MIITNPSISSSVGAFLPLFIITAHLFLHLSISTMHGTLSTLSSIMGAMAHYPLLRGIIEQLSVIAAKFGVCTMAPTHTSLQCIIETSRIDACFECHGTMEDTMKFLFISLHGFDIFNTPSGAA